MKTIRLLFCLFLLCAVNVWSQTVFAAPMTEAPSNKPAQSINIIPTAAEIGQQIQALVTGDPDAEGEPQETFGTRALGLVMALVDMTQKEGVAFVTNLSALPQIASWYDQQISDPILTARWVLIGQQMVMVVGIAFAVGWMFNLMFLPVRRRLVARESKTFYERLGTAAAWMGACLISAVVFLGAAVVLLEQSNPTKTIRFVVMNVVYALALHRLVCIGVRFLVAPRAPNLRLMPLATDQAKYVSKWIGIISFVMIYGYFLVDVAHLMHVPPAATATFSNLLSLTIVIMAITVIVQKRSFVSIWLRGNLTVAQSDLTLWESLRLWLARQWHVLAISYLIIGYIVTTLSANDGFRLMQRGTLITLFILILTRFSFYVAQRIASNRKAATSTTVSVYHKALHGLVSFAIWILAFVAILAAWGVDMGALFATPWGQRILGSVFSITVTIVLVVTIYELIEGAIERKLNRHDAQGRVIEVNARVRTLLPMIRNVALITLGAGVALVILSEVGVNIGPFLAGAGVLGVAIGFGSQTLVKDFITGLFIILEDAIAIGDVVSIGTYSGVVEAMTIRTVRLRDAEGALHILPFSELSKISNMTKSYAFALMDVNVSYSSDLDHVINVMRAVGDELQEDMELTNFILEPIEVLGVEKFLESAITMRCRIKTRPGKQWVIKRQYLLRVKKRFEAENIGIPVAYLSTAHWESKNKA